MIFNYEFETLPREALEALQLKRLQQVAARCYHTVSFYRKAFDNAKIKPEDIKSLADLKRLPFTVKQDLRDNYPFGLFTVPMSNVVRLHASTGTTGNATVVGYTKRDIETWAELMARCFAAAGLTGNDIIHNAYGYGLFTGGLGAHYGAEALGATVIPISGGNTDRQIMVMQDFRVTAICCTPSYFVHIIERAKELGVDMHSLPLRAGVFGAEPWTEAVRKHVEAETNIKAYDIYGLSEIIGPGVAIECEQQNGLHLFEDHFYPEIISPETGEPLPDGEEGELVITTLSKRAMPLLRYRTRDITRIIPEPCPCGRTIRKIQRIGRRSDDMFIIRGVNVYPSQVEAALLEVEGTLPHYQIILTRSKGLDEMEVQVEVTPHFFSDRVSELENLRNAISRAIEHTIGIRAKISLVEPHTIERSMGKAKRVFDKREG